MAKRYNAVDGDFLRRHQALACYHYCEAIRINPDYVNAHYNLGVVLIKKGKQDEGIRHLSEAIRIDPQYAEAKKNLKIIMRKTGKTSGTSAVDGTP